MEVNSKGGAREQFASTYLHRYGQRDCENAQKESDRENPFSQIHKSTVFSPQKGLDREQNHSGPIEIERIYINKFFQDAHTQTGETLTSSGSMDSFFGPERWFLPPDGLKEIQTLPRVLLQGSEMEVQGNALRPQYCPTNLYKDNVIQYSLPNQRRDMGFTLSRRHSDYSQDKIGMSSESTESCTNLGEVRMDYKHREVQIDTSTSIQLAGSTLQLTQSHSPKHCGNSQSVPNTTEGTSHTENNHQTPYNAFTGTGELVRTSQSTSSPFPVQNQTTIEPPQESKTRHRASSEQSHEVSDGEMVNSNEEPSTSRPSKNNMHSFDGCVQDRLGFHHKPTKVPRKVRQIHGQLQYQCPGTPNHMVVHLDDTREGPHITYPYGQQFSGLCNKKSIIQRQHSSQHSRTDLEESGENELDYIHSPHRGEVQHLGRPIVKKHNHFNRMGHPTGSIPGGDSAIRTTSRSGSICHVPQPQITNICVPLPRPISSGSRCPVDRMEQVAVHLSVSPESNDFEGFTETRTIKGQNSHLAHPRRTYPSMVPSSKVKTNTTACTTHTVATNSGEHPHSRKQNFQNSRLEVLKIGNYIKYPELDTQTLNLISAPVKKTSEKDYQRKWNYFQDFLKQKGIPFNDIVIEVVMKFFSHLFYSKGLKPSTISHYRAALSQPLSIYSNIDLRVPAVQSMLRAMRLQRPNEPSSRPAWNLSRVLTYLENLDTTSITQSLRKAAFLLLLATGWRISELHACVRDEDFCRFTERSSLIIRPHSSFLAKNGLRKRLESKEIKILKTPEGNVSNICPVTALRTYFEHTSEFKVGCLFLNPKNKKSISLPQIRQHICSLITEADPNTKAKVHDIRKFAASCSLQQDMLVGDLTEDFNWSTPAVFYKFYFMQTDALQRPVSLPVRS